MCAGEERFSSTVNAGRLAELEHLQEFLQAAVAAVDATVAVQSAPAERLRRLLSAPDKKATLLQMAGELPCEHTRCWRVLIRLSMHVDLRRPLIGLSCQRGLQHNGGLPEDGICVAGDGEIDRALLDLMQQNIDAATAAGQAQAVEFMTKIRVAAMKFLITT